jgi:hypothetical protein
VLLCPQLRLKCLETLLQLLSLIQADAAATAAFKATAAAAAAAEVSACLSGVAANDPSVAHKALAAQAAAVLAKMQ